MRIRLNSHSGEPIWRQIVEQMKYRVASGQLADGDRLPSIRVLAGELKINPRTVVKAYEELQHAGIVVMRQGQGVFVTARRGAASAQARRVVLMEMARRLMAEASRLGASPEEVAAILEKVRKEMEGTAWSTTPSKPKT
jgi:GntR family transcriptional regulator